MKPLILSYAVERSEGSKTVYEYSNVESLNVIVNTKGEIIPFIDINNGSIELQTKTKVESEKDDDSFSMLALQTKTEVNQERDDEVKTLLELQTKTFTKTEQDDN